MNNADLTVQFLRELQQIALHRETSPDKMVKKIDFAIERANKASKQINSIEATLNRIINKLDDMGLFQGEVISAFTGLSLEEAKKYENNLAKAKKEIIK